MGNRLSNLHETFGLDLRSLGILRILIGGMILVDLIIRAVSLRAHYTDFGILPVDAQMHDLTGHPGRFSFHMESGDLNLQIWLFAISGLVGLTLLVGFHTRLSLLASLVLMISVQNRNMEIETGGDYLLRLICMWGLLLPLGARFSLDARSGRGVVHESSPCLRGNQYFSLATLGILVQMFSVYFFSALHKSHPIWREHDLAIHYALHIDAYDTSLGDILREFPMITAAMTRLTLGYEFVAPWAIFGAGLIALVPGLENSRAYQGPLRTIVSITFFFFHIGLGMALSLGTFAWFAMLIWIGLLPTYFWDQIALWRRGKPIFVIEPEDETVEQAKEKKKKKPKRPRWALEWLDRLEWFGHAIETPRKGSPPTPGATVRKLRAVSRWGADLCAAVLLFYTMVWNLRTLERSPYDAWISGRGDSLLPDARPLLNFIRLDQHWGLFAPYPRTTDGYYVVLGTQRNGRQIDYLRPDLRVTWEKPADVSGSYETFRWRKYFRNIRRPGKRPHLRLYSQYVCRDWNETHSGDDALQGVEIYFMARKTKASGGHEPTRKERLWRQRCPTGPEGSSLRGKRPLNSAPSR